jgi:hypothetical protein
MRAPWKKEIGACALTRSENVKEWSVTTGAADAGEVADGVGAVGEEALMTIVVDVFETVAGVAGAE